MLDYIRAINKWAYQKGYGKINISNLDPKQWFVLKKISVKFRLQDIKSLYNWLNDHNYLKYGLLSLYVQKGIKEYFEDLKLRAKLYG